MREIRNPFIGREEYSCFGCSPFNNQGLRMKFSEDGEELTCSWEPEAKFAGYGGILHGGVQATLHDEIASWVVFVKLSTAGFTQRLEIDYRNPVRVDSRPLILKSRVESVDGNKAYIKTRLYDGRGKLGSESLAVYFTLPQHIARKRLAFPEDPTSFFEPA